MIEKFILIITPIFSYIKNNKPKLGIFLNIGGNAHFKQCLFDSNEVGVSSF